MAVNEKHPFRTLVASAAAVALLAAAALAAPDAPAADPCRSGRGQYAAGDVLRAIASLEKCVERSPRNRDAWATLAVARLEAGRFAPSAEAYARAHALKAGDAAFLAGYLDALEGAGQRPAQVPVLRALAESSRDARPHARRLLALADSLGAAAHAEDRLFALEVLAQGPEAEIRHQERLASAYLSLGRHDQARSEYRGLLARRPENGEYWAGLAASIAGEDRAGALECYRKAIFYSNQASARADYEGRAAILKAAESRVASAPPAKAAALPASAPAPVAAPPSAPVTAKIPPATVAAAASAPAAPEPPAPRPSVAPAPAPAAKASVPLLAAAPAAAKPAPSAAPAAPAAPAAAPKGPSPSAPVMTARPFDLKAFQDSVYKAELEKRLAALRKSGQLPAVPAPAAKAADAPPATAPAATVPMASSGKESGDGKDAAVRAAKAKEEQERLAREAEAKAKAEREDAERREKLAKEAKAEEARLAREAEAKAREEQAVKDKLAREEKAKQEALAAEKKAEAERQAREKRAEEERLAKEAARRAAEAQAAKDKVAREEKERQERLAREKKAEEERVAKQVARRERRDRAVALYKRGSLDSADALFDTVTAESPDPEAWFFAGRADLDKGRAGRALKRLEKAGRDQADLDRFVGKANLRLGNRREALAAFDRQYARTSDADVLEDICALRRGGPDSLYVACLETLSSRRPQVPRYHAELAAHHARRGDKARSLERYARILALESGHGEANLHLGLDWSSQGVHDRAVPLLVKAVAAFPDRGPAWKALAKGQAALGRKDEARASWAQAARLLPRDVETARGRLASLREAAAGSAPDLEGAYLALLELAPEDREAALGYARLRFQARDWAAAEKHFRIGCRESREAAAWGQFGRTLLELGRRDEAAEALQKAVDLGENGRGLRLDLARIHLEKGDADRAEALMKRLSSEAPSDPAPYHGLALVAARRQQTAVQEENLRKANQLKPDDPVYAVDLAALYRDREACPQALSVLAPAEKSLDPAGRALQADCLAATGDGARALEIYSDLYGKRPSGDLLSRRIDALVRAGRSAEALDAARGTPFAGHPAVRFSLAKAHLALSESLVLKADLEQAVSLLEDALDDEPHRAEYHYVLGSTYAAQRRWKKAMGAYTDALKYRVEYPEAVLGKGRCLVELGRHGEARNFFNELSQHADPRWRARGLTGLAQVFEAEGKWEAVEHHLGRAVAAHPHPDAMAYLSRVHHGLGRFPEAEDWARRALALDPSHEAGNLAMAEALAARKKMPEALGLASAALRLKPLSCDLLVQSAKLNLEAGRVDSTLETTGKAMQACPEEPLAHFYAGMAHRSAKRTEEARRHFKSFTRLGGDRKLVPE